MRDDATATFAAIQAIDQPDAVNEEDLAHQVEDLAPGDAMLVVKRGSNVGATYLLDKDVVKVGRNPEADVFLDDVTVSRKHAEFRRMAGRFGVADVGSLNGTYVNGDLKESSDLEGGDEVQIGKFKLVFLMGNQKA